MSPPRSRRAPLTVVLTWRSAPASRAPAASHRYVFLTSRTAALGTASPMVTSLFGERNEKFLTGLKQSGGIPNSSTSAIHVTPLVLTVSATAGSLSSRATLAPPRAAASAADEPAGPAPTTTMS